MTARAAAARSLERAEEIEKVKRRRIEREEEKAQREKEAVEAARLKAWEEGAELNRKEETFHLEQAKVRAAARLVDGRGTAADVLAKELHLLAPPWRLPAEASPPHLSWVSSRNANGSIAASNNNVDGSLCLEELKELVDDVRGWIELDCAEEVSRKWWSASLIAAEDALSDFQKNSSAASASVSASAAAASASAAVGVHASVEDDVRAMLLGKSPAQLLELEKGIRARLASGELPDPDYWAGVLRRIARARARAELGEMHRELVAAAVEACAAEDAAEAAEEEARRRGGEGAGGSGGNAPLRPLPPPGSAAAAAASVLANAGIDRRNREAEQRRSLSPGAGGEGGEEDGGGEGERAQRAAASAAAAAAALERNDGRFSPPPLSSSEADALSASSSSGAFVELVDADEDARLRTYLRARARYHAARRLFAASVLSAASAAAGSSGSGSSGSTAAAKAFDAEERDAASPTAIYRALALAHGSASDRAAALEEDDEEGEGGGGGAGAAAASFRALAASAMADAGGAGDFPFTADALSDIPSSSASSHRRIATASLLDDDRYRPRKPLFHNRVHTGFDWNKYVDFSFFLCSSSSCPFLSFFLRPEGKLGRWRKGERSRKSPPVCPFWHLLGRDFKKDTKKLRKNSTKKKLKNEKQVQFDALFDRQPPTESRPRVQV